MRRTSHRLAGALVAASVSTATALPAGTVVRAPMTCSRGPGGASFAATLGLPASVAQGARFAVRIDALPSGEISHFGLNYIHDMTTDFLVARGATYVAGSARIVPGTGTANVAGSARVSQKDGVIRLVLPGRVASGSSYTPPSIEFQLEASAAAGTALPLSFLEYRVTANAIVVGDLETICAPTPRPYPIGTTLVTASP